MKSKMSHKLLKKNRHDCIDISLGIKVQNCSSEIFHSCDGKIGKRKTKDEWSTYKAIAEQNLSSIGLLMCIALTEYGKIDFRLGFSLPYFPLN